jgi:hypothetical protein
LLGWIRTVVLALPLLVGLVCEQQQLSVPLFEPLRDNSSQPYRWAVVNLQPPVQLYQAKISFVAEMGGLKYWMSVTAHALPCRAVPCRDVSGRCRSPAFVGAVP